MTDDFATKLAQVQKKYQTGVGPISKIAQPSFFLSTGNMALDKIVGGGLPLGRAVELAGPPSSGKTTTALQCAAVAQKMILSGGGDLIASDGTVFHVSAEDKILYMDYEATIDQDYCVSLGLDIDDDSFLLVQPDTLEDGANLAIDLIETGRIRVVIWDSVASMLPSSKAQAEIGKSLPAVQAKLMSDLGAKLVPLLYKHQTLNIWVNHLKEMLDMTGRRPAHLGPKMGTPGGVALKFYESVRIEYKQIKNIKEKEIDLLSGQEVETPGATEVEVKVVKNKVAPPFKKAVVRVRFGRGFDNFWTALMFLIAAKEVMYSSGYYYFHKVEEHGLAPEWMPRAKTGIQRPNIRTDAAILQAADDHPEWREAVIEYAAALLKNTDAKVIGGPSPEEAELEAEEDRKIDEILPVNLEGNRVGI
jgi:recombination protein RecA